MAMLSDDNSDVKKRPKSNESILRHFNEVKCVKTVILK
jgi:hypothetical protein